jgi:hypothetical protein
VSSYTFTNVRTAQTIDAQFRALNFIITPAAGAGGTISPNTPQTVPYGGSATFAIAPNTGYRIADVLVDNASVGAVPSHTFSNVRANHTITASFAILTYVITPTAGAGGTISPNTPQTVNHGGSKTFTIAPNAGYRVADVLVDGVSVGAVASHTFSNVQANHTIAASFAILTYVITPSAGAGGTISPNTSQTVNHGGSKTFTIAANAGYWIADVKVDGVSVGAVSSYTFSNVQADHTIAASFTALTYVITPSAGMGGTISPNTPQTVPHASSKTFTIAPNPGYGIADVRVDGASVGAVATYTFSNVTGNHTIDASFAILSFVITPTVGAGGTITPGTAQTVLYGSDKKFDIAASTGYVIADVKVDGVSQGPLATYTFVNVTAHHTIAATFTRLTYVITPTAGTGGTISPNLPQTVPYGGSATFTIAANSGYVIADVKVDGASVGAVASHTFSDVKANHTIAASFAVRTYTITPTAGAGGTISPNAPQTVNHGANTTFTIAANIGFVIADVKVDGASVGIVASYTFNNVTANHTIEATFAATPTEFAASLGVGWNLFSTPVALAAGSDGLPQIFALGLSNIEIAYRWDAALRQWVALDATFHLSPLEAIAVKVKTAAITARLVPSQQLTWPPSRSLVTGLNLIGPAPAFDGNGFPAIAAANALASIEQAPGGLTGYSMVISPAMNQPGWSYVRGGSPQNLLAYKGYWVVMENPDTLYGFSTTPLVP